MTKLVVTKRDAALRQLRTAIVLWFNDGDVLAIHTLAHASHEIIHRMYRNAGHRSLLFDTDKIRKEHRQKWTSAVRHSANFLKHASHDLSEKLDFKPESNELLLSMSVEAVRVLEAKPGMEELTFNLWMTLHRPAMYHLKNVKRPPDVQRTIDEVRALGRAEFFELFKDDEKVRAVFRRLLHGDVP